MANRRPRRSRRRKSRPPEECFGDPVDVGLRPQRFLKIRFAQCPLRLSLGFLGRKWTLLILRNIAIYRIDRFNRLLDSLPGIPPKVLSARLRELESMGFVRKIEARRRPRRIRRDLTEKGRDLLPLLMMLAAFHSKWDPETVHPGRASMRIGEIYDRDAVRILERFL